MSFSLLDEALSFDSMPVAINDKFDQLVDTLRGGVTDRLTQLGGQSLSTISALGNKAASKKLKQSKNGRWSRALALPDPLVTNRWEAELLFPTGSPSIRIPDYITAVKMPNTEYNTVTVFRNGSQENHVGDEDAKTGSLTFYEAHDLRMARMFTQWLRMIKSANGVFTPIGKLRSTLTLYSLAPTLARSGKTEIVGFLPISVESPDYVSGNSAAGETTVNFICLDVKITPA